MTLISKYNFETIYIEEGRTDGILLVHPLKKKKKNKNEEKTIYRDTCHLLSKADVI